MRRMSSLPTAEFCPMTEKVGTNIESTAAARGTVFHHYCATGEWPASFHELPAVDQEQIQRWFVPHPFPYTADGVTYQLAYENAVKEEIVALDHDFEHVEVDPACPQAEIARCYPNVMACGHLDMCWPLPERDLVLVMDIKSTIFGVPDRTNSLQLHGYGMGAAKRFKVNRYVTGIWDASDGKYLVRPEGAVELDSFEAEDIRARIRVASSERDGGYKIGTYCGGCWKRRSCEAHMVVPADSEFRSVFDGSATGAEVRQALIRLKQLEDVKEAAWGAVKAWVAQNGPVNSEDGTKQYRYVISKGRSGVDNAAVARALGMENLDSFKREGKPYEKLQWTNSKE